MHEKKKETHEEPSTLCRRFFRGKEAHLSTPPRTDRKNNRTAANGTVLRDLCGGSVNELPTLFGTIASGYNILDGQR